MGLMTCELVKFRNPVRIEKAATGGPVGGNGDGN